MKNTLLPVILVVLQALQVARLDANEEEDRVFGCRGHAFHLAFFKRSEIACVKWYKGATTATLSSALAALSGAGHVELSLKPKGLQKLALWRRKLKEEESLDLLSGETLEACQVVGGARAQLETRFLYLLPRVDVSNYPLLRLQLWKETHSFEEVEKLLRGSVASSASWLQRDDGTPARLLQPSYSAISTLFPTHGYRRVEFKDPEQGLLQHHSSYVFSYPMKASAFYCASQTPALISPLGKKQIKAALSLSTGTSAEVAMLLARHAEDVNTEQDPTLVLVQFFKGPRNEAVPHETVIHTEMEQAPVLTSRVVKQQDKALVSNFLADNNRLLSRLGGYFSKLALTRCFVWTFAAMANIDLEEAFSLKQTLKRKEQGFSSMQEFFMRPINLEVLRPIDSTAVLVAPADSVVQNAFFVEPNQRGELIDAHIPQVKGTTFSLSEFLFGRGTNQEIRLSNPSNRLFVGIYYLAPTDYHRFHSATDWKATRHIYIPGCLPSVRRSVLLNRSILDAFERTSVHGHWSPGNRGGPRMFFSMTFVAARMVGGIELFYRHNLDSNKFSKTAACGASKKSIVYDYERPVNICMGQELGAFKFGSTVVVIFEAPRDFEFRAPSCQHVDVNSTAGTLSGSGRKTLPRCDFTYGNFKSPLDYLRHLQSLLGAHQRSSGSSVESALLDSEGVPSDAWTTASERIGGDAAQVAALGEVDLVKKGSSAELPTPGATKALEGIAGPPEGAGPIRASTLIPSSERGTEDGAPPQSTFLGGRENSHEAVHKTVLGDETDYSALKNLKGKVRAIEFGLLNRFALARWLRREWEAERRGMALLQVGQLQHEEADTNGPRKPLCYFDREEGSVLLRFEGRLSNLLLEMPADPFDSFLTRYPIFACGSPKHWGKVTRGVAASWTLRGGSLTATFSLSLGRVDDENRGVVETVAYTFTGTPRLLKGDVSASKNLGIVKYALGGPKIENRESQFFAITQPQVFPVETAAGIPSELSCPASPVFSFKSAGSNIG